MSEFVFSDHAKSLLSKYYMQEGEQSPQESFKRASFFYAKSTELAERIYNYACKGWFMFRVQSCQMQEVRVYLSVVLNLCS